MELNKGTAYYRSWRLIFIPGMGKDMLWESQGYSGWQRAHNLLSPLMKEAREAKVEAYYWKERFASLCVEVDDWPGSNPFSEKNLILPTLKALDYNTRAYFIFALGCPPDDDAVELREQLGKLRKAGNRIAVLRVGHSPKLAAYCKEELKAGHLWSYVEGSA